MTEAATPPLEQAFTGTKPVEDRHRFDQAKLEAWLKENVAGYEGPLTVLQFKGGQSNPTYRLDTPGRSYVLRRKPFGKLLPSAHAVDREFRVISALHGVGFPVAKPYGLCMDDGVIGEPPVEGLAQPVTSSPSRRRSACETCAATETSAAYS